MGISDASGSGSRSTSADVPNVQASFHQWVGLIPDLIYRISLQGEILWANLEASSVWPFSVSQIAGSSFEALFPPELLGHSWVQLVANVEAGYPLSIEHPLHWPDRIRWFETRLARRPAESGSGEEILGITREIAGSPGFGALRRASERRLLFTLRSAGLVAWELDRAGQIHETGPVDQVFGRPRGFGHRSLADFEQDIEPADRELVRERIQRTWREGGDYRVEYRVRAADGKLRWLEANGTLVRDDAGRPERLLGVARNITERRLAEEDLRQFTAVQRTVLNTINIGICFLKDRKHQWINPAFGTIFGYESHEVVGLDSWGFYVYEADYQRVGLEGYARLAEAGVYNTECLMKRKDGRQFWCGITGQAVNPQDLGEGTIWALRDITKRKETEEALRRSEAQLRGIAQNLPGMVFQFYARLNGERGMYFVSDRSLDFLGLDNRQLDGMLEKFIAGVVAEDREQLLGSINAAVSAVAPWEFEGRYRKPNGEEVYLRGVSLPRPLDQEVIFDGLMLDITARKRAEAALERERIFTDAVLNSVPGLLYLYDDSGRLVRWNRQHEILTGYSGEELAQMHLLDWHRDMPEQQARISAAVKRIPIEGQVTEEALLVTKSGQRIPFYFTAVRLQIDQRDYFVGVGIDMRERNRIQASLRQHEEMLRQSQKMEAVGQLAGGVAHDFNNILSAMLLHLGALQVNPALDLRTREALGELQTEATRAANLTRQLLLFSRRSVLEVRPLNLQEVVTQLLKMLRRLLGEQIQIEFQCPASLPMVQGDCGMMEQVVMNLAVNARDAMPRGGKLLIRAEAVAWTESQASAEAGRAAGNYVVLSVIDTGCGMSEATLKHIFEPFFTTKSATQGTGLGLATVYGIVQQHHGWIEVESALELGTTFRVWLPAQATVAPPPVVGTLASPVVGGTETILVVEDETMVRRTIAQTLRVFGYKVIEVANADEALKQWRQNLREIALLLTDVVMPGTISGLELAERLRSEKPQLKIILCSGYSAEILKQGQAQLPGAVRLPKPFSGTVLASTVRHCLDDPSHQGSDSPARPPST